MYTLALSPLLFPSHSLGIQALNEALLQVRAELLDATQKALLGHTHHEVKEVNIQKLVQKRTSELEVEMAHLILIRALLNY